MARHLIHLMAIMIALWGPAARAAVPRLTAMLDHPTPAWKPLVDSLHVRGRLTNGDTIDYALGLVVSDYRGVHRVEHSGATAGYRAIYTDYDPNGGFLFETWLHGPTIGVGMKF